MFPKRPLKESIGILYNYGPGVTSSTPCVVQADNTRTVVRTSQEPYNRKNVI